MIRRLLLGALLSASLAACQSVSQPPQPYAAASTGDDSAWYIGSMPDKPFNVPLVDRSRMDAKYARQTVAYNGPEKPRSEEHTSELQSRQYLVCRLLLEKKTTHSSLFPK